MSQPVPSTDSAFVQRENSLLLWSALLRAKPQAELGLYQGTTVSGVLCSTNAGLDGFVLRDMQSPFGTYKAAEIRSQDVRHIQIDRW
ncbi:uncharacterized protein BJ171DRAFT_581615 [Polychytrium aggregatum]|uniref:uncharacterized protein n=1 Tax=Polychytrium aggregatum TaxID=110093 RepID=UPI0022FF30BC|nr:uncharacterized protein BJ171DRAFT_581615 [Polychytrium aggregatum]KAI9204935.1 hypothetical protein BJ171DRAFT_581615 [Polychytrium aggregatum]